MKTTRPGLSLAERADKFGNPHVRFTPTSIGALSANFVVSGIGSESIRFVLHGIGTGSSVPQIMLSDSGTPADDLRVPFDSMAAATSSINSITVLNEGTAILRIGSIAVENVLSEPFSIAEDLCSLQAIDPGMSCTIEVMFSPIHA